MLVNVYFFHPYFVVNFMLYLFSRLYTQRAFNFHYKLIVCRSMVQRRAHNSRREHFGCNLNSLTFSYHCQKVVFCVIRIKVKEQEREREEGEGWTIIEFVL